MQYNNHFPPLVFVENDKTVGIVDDVLKAIGDVTGDTFIYVEAPFQRAMMLFEAGEVDLEPSVSPAWREESKASVYTIPYRRSVDAMLFPNASSVVAVQSPTDLIGKTIGVVRGYKYPGYDRYFEGGTLHKVESRDEDMLLEKLRLGRVDVVFIHKPYAQYMMKINEAYRDFRFGSSISELDIMMRLNVGRKDALPRFNEALRKLLDDGEIERILAKYR